MMPYVRLIVSLYLATRTANAFHVATRTTTKRSCLNAAYRVQSVGAGIPLYPAGSVDETTERFKLFDPAQEGKLGGTDSLDQRLQQGYSYLAPTADSTTTSTTTQEQVEDAQHWLEDLEQPVPKPFAKASASVTATVLGRGRLIGDDAPGDIQHVVLQLPEHMHYIEGQSLSVIPPHTDHVTADNKKPHKPRLYSIASTRYGDLLDGRTVSLCVRRAVYIDPVTGIEDPSKQGVCSNFLCDVNPGDTVQVAGPVGKTMLLPDDASTDIIMVATGTGIAPFRAFMHRLFMENTVARHMYQGKAWLILGVPTTSGLLYENELNLMQANANSQLEVSYAISREMTNAQGGKLYVQHVLAERIQDVLERLDHGAVIYFCGLKGMMPGILEALETACTEQGLDWTTKFAEWKKNGQWHVEVY